MRLPLTLIITLAPGLVQHVQEIFTVRHRDQFELLGHRIRRFRFGAGRARSRHTLNKTQQQKRRRRFQLPRFHLTLPSLRLTHRHEKVEFFPSTRNEAVEKRFEVSFQRGSQLWWAFFLGSLVIESTKTALAGGGAGPVGHLLATMLPLGTLARQPVVAPPKASASRWLLATLARRPVAPPPPPKASASRWLLALMLPTAETLRQPVIAPPKAAVSPSRWLPAHRRATDMTRARPASSQQRRSTGKRNASSSSSTESTRKRRATATANSKNEQQQRPRKKQKKIKQDEELWAITRALIPQKILDSHRGRVAGRKHKW